MDALDIFIQLVKENEDYIINLNTKEQLYKKGIDSTGAKIKKGYSESYKKVRIRAGLPTNRVMLYRFGNYHKSYRVIANRTDISITSFNEIQRGVNLSEKLREKYGVEIEGLTKENEDKFYNKIEPEFEKRIALSIENELNKVLSV